MNERRGKQNSGAPRSSGAARGAPGGSVSTPPGYPGRVNVNPEQGGEPNPAPRKAGGKTRTTAGRNNPGAAQSGARQTASGGKAANNRQAGSRGAVPPNPSAQRMHPDSAGQVRRKTTGQVPAGQAPGRQAAGGQALSRRSAGRPGSNAPAGRGHATRQGASANRRGARPAASQPAGRRAAGKRSRPGKLHAQTAAERRRHINERRGHTPEQMAFIQRRKEIKRYYVKKRRISAITLFFTRFTALVIIYLVLFVLTSGLFVLSLVSSGPPRGEDVKYQLGENKNDIVYKTDTLEYGDRVRDGQVYLNFTEIAEYLDFITSGEPSRLRYLTKYTDGEEIVFDVGTTSVTVNGNMIRMPAASYYKGGVLYVPLDFIKTYVRGISVGTNEKNGTIVLYRLYTLSPKNEKIYEDITFSLKTQLPTEHIDENSLPADIKLATEPSRLPQPPEGNWDKASASDITG